MNALPLPAATRILSPRAKRTSWLRVRRGYLCSSDVAPALGIHEYDSAHPTAEAVYHTKKGNLPDEDSTSEAAFWARQFENTIAKTWAERNNTALHRVGLVANTERLIDGRPWMACTLRRQVERCPDGDGPCALLVLSRNAFVAGRWRLDVPDAILVRALWVALTCGFTHVHLAVLFGGNDLRDPTVRVGKHRGLARRILAGGERFWRENILADVVPTAAGEAKARIKLYERLHARRRGVVELAGDPRLTAGKIPELVLQRVKAGATKGSAERQHDEAKADLLAILGDAQMATFKGEPVFWVDHQARRHVDMKELKERHPRVYRRCVTDRPVQVLKITGDEELLARLGRRG